MSGIAVVSMLHCYFRQRRTIGSFLATAGLLLSYNLPECSKKVPMSLYILGLLTASS